jgi:hypothetical protein
MRVKMDRVGNSQGARAPLPEREEVPMPIVGGLDIHRKQITFDYLDTVTGQVRRGRISPADRAHLRAWLARFAGREDAAFAVEGCTGWRYVTEELAAAGVAVHLAEPADTAFARGRKRHAKTDPLTDCRHLRMLLAEGRLPECWIPPGHILECRATSAPERSREQTGLESPACTAGSQHHRRPSLSRMAEKRRKITGITCR